MAQRIELPSNVEAERAVLGSIINFPDDSDEAFSLLKEEDFSGVDPRNPLIFRALGLLHKQNPNSIDPETLHGMLVNLNLDKPAGGSEYLFELISHAINPDNISYYINMVHEQAVLRRLLLQCRQIEDTYAKGVSDIGQFILKSNEEIANIAQQRHVQSMLSAKDVAEAVSTRIANSRNPSEMTGVRTGYRRLDMKTHGWQKGDLIILAARPAVGKTAFGLNLAYNAAHMTNKPVAFFSLEMSSELIMSRLIASRSYVSNEHITTGMLDNHEKVKVASAIEEISNTPLYFDDTPNCRLGDILSKARKLKNAHEDLSLIVIDYLGRIRYSDRVDFNARQQEVAYISGELKTLARNLEVPVICLSQLNRNVDKAENKIPSLADLRESGAIEQDADIVMLMYREDYYTDIGLSVKKGGWKSGGKEQEEEQPKPKLSDEEKAKTGDVSDVTISIAKNRNGQIGSFHLLFQKAFSRFDDPSPEYEQKQAALRSGGGSGGFED